MSIGAPRSSIQHSDALLNDHETKNYCLITRLIQYEFFNKQLQSNMSNLKQSSEAEINKFNQLLIKESKELNIKMLNTKPLLLKFKLNEQLKWMFDGFDFILDQLNKLKSNYLSFSDQLNTQPSQLDLDLNLDHFYLNLESCIEGLNKLDLKEANTQELQLVNDQLTEINELFLAQLNEIEELNQLFKELSELYTEELNLKAQAYFQK
ncbi:hypothetical protein CONCODRAFT_78624 [Conidiobolus coronatus NRRL 28638]|uniref:Uncharacterized protein n=1 Tax=Conidiobolus coronatus (strain ATCC 28846 / CBS 209.66 / NRRL 28638) TaxID=796925 RepID=A0A137P7B9_CONC2|nr:hypothetical protein CONCODRAFT_78624 [Conidiobolus coronatus NRRL 28638]|eukprot:KXN70859.1 hypothetical protein CONCODRAFT_78624 [Conidiobolus coronatus NRRL 28638]